MYVYKFQLEALKKREKDQQIISILFEEGAKTRYYFTKRGMLDTVKRLKAIGIVETIRRNTNYAYGLTSFGYFARMNSLV